MEQAMEMIEVTTTVNAPIGKVWDCWTQPKHIVQWCTATDTWHTPRAENDLRTGGTFTTRMEAKDGSMGFDMGGTYTQVEPHKYIAYNMGHERKVTVEFRESADGVHIIERFDPENQNPREMQQAGWQAILDNFKKHTESV